MTAVVVRGGSVRPFEEGRNAEWDELVAKSVNGTFLYTRRFISYHGDRFRGARGITHDHYEIPL